MATEAPMDELNFRRGYYHAVAVLCGRFDEPTVAADILGQYGPLDFRGIDELDIAVLRDLAKAEGITG